MEYEAVFSAKNRKQHDVQISFYYSSRIIIFALWLSIIGLVSDNDASSRNSHVLLVVGNSADKLRHPRSGAHSALQVLLNKQQISGGVACLYWCLTFILHENF